MFFPHRTIFSVLFIIICVFSSSADQIIEDFEPPNDPLLFSSYPGEDHQSSHWRFDSNQGAGGTSNSLYLYGNTWKMYDISDRNIEISPDSIWEIYVRVPLVATVTAFGFTDGTNEVIYSLEAYETPQTSGPWILAYTGWKNTFGSFQRFKLPVGRDFNDRYGPIDSRLITSLIFINDGDTTVGTVYFDQIADITEAEPQPPIVNIGDDIEVNVAQGIDFTCEVTDPDSASFDYHWDFGDGDTNTSSDPWHAFIAPGIYNVLLTVKDSTSLIGMDSLLVTVGNDPPEPVASLLYAGDVMFGRRFEDPDDTEQLIYPWDQGSGAKNIGKYTRGFSSDLKIINLESPLTDEGYVHPAKQYTFRSRPDAVAGITECGAEMICLANNHLIDYMDRGVEETLEVLDNPTYYSPYARDVDLKYTGGGMSREDATQPTFFVQNGLRIGFVGLCSITGHSGNEQPYFQAGYEKPGVLLLNEPNLRNAVGRCEAVADVTVVLIHGGTEYSDYPSSYVQPLAQLAIDLGAKMVVCHHPHVSQGIEIYNGVPIVYSLGNYIFDQKYQHTMMSFMADTRIDYNGVHQLSIVPFYLERFIPKFLTGDAGVRSIHRLMRLSEFLGTTIVPDTINCRGIVKLGPAIFNTTSSSQNIEMPTTYRSSVSAYVSDAFEIPADKHLSGITSIVGASGNRYLLMGQDMLMFGSFEEEDIDNETLESPGWTIPGTTSASISDYNPYEGELCLRLRRHRNDSYDIDVSSYRRIPVETGKKYMLCGYVRTHDSGNVWVTVTSHIWPYTWDDWRDTEILVMGS
ncbi:CapA family protein, partial [bacterium]|nr:CapA family protein [bacterium]